MPCDVPLAKIYRGFYTCRICLKKSNKGRKEKSIKYKNNNDNDNANIKQVFVCEECLFKNKKGELDLR